MNCKQLDAMSLMDIEVIDRNELVNIKEVLIDTKLPAPERMLRYLDEIKNPYCFMCGDVPVKITFSSEGSELAELLKKHFMTLKR